MNIKLKWKGLVARTLFALAPIVNAYAAETATDGEAVRPAISASTSCYSRTIRIRFYSDGGSGSMSTVSRRIYTCADSYYTLPSCRFTRSGYTFAGWRVSNSCSAVCTDCTAGEGEPAIYYEGDDISLDYLCDYSVTATWRYNAPSRYTLTCDPNGGVLSGGNFGWRNGTSYSADVTVTYGGRAYSALGAATRTGYRFRGWYTSTYGGTQVYGADGRAVLGTSYWSYAGIWQWYGDVTLYAQWEAGPSRYTLTCDPNGGVLSGGNFGWRNGTSYSADVTVTYGGRAYSALGAATRTGYRFRGWYTSTYGGTQVYGADGRAVLGTSYWNYSSQWQWHGNVTLYAQWEELASYTLTLNPNGGVLRGGNFGSANGTTRNASVTVTYGRASYSALGSATRTGYRFRGWYTSTYGGTQVYNASGRAVTGSYWNSSNQWQWRGNVTLYAQWETPSSYTLTLNPNGGMLRGGNFGSANGTTRSASVTVTIGRSSYWNLGTAMRSGYQFTGWYTSSGTQVFDASGRAITGTAYWDSSRQWNYYGNVTLYAQWSSATIGGYTTGGNANWSLISDGSWRSGSITHGQSTWLQQTVSGAGTVSFQWKVSSEQNYDYLRFYIDGVEQGNISGTVGWASVSRTFSGSGSHTLRWEYSKDGSVDNGSDCGWVKNVQINGSGVFTTGGDANWSPQSDGSWRSGSITDNQSTRLETVVSGSGIVRFEWKVSSELNYDYLRFYVDGVEKLYTSGESAWSSRSYTISGSGTHTLRWVYSKDGSVANGSDCGWIRNFQYR